MPAQPVLERVTSNLFDCIKGITRQNGFTETIEPARESKLGNSPGNVTDPTLNTYAVFVVGPKVPDELAPLGKDQWWQTYWIQCYSIEPDSVDASEPADVRNERLLSDITKAVNVDYTRGGLAIDTRVTLADPMNFNLSDFRGIVVQVSVHYRTAADDPFTQ